MFDHLISSFLTKSTKECGKWDAKSYKNVFYGKIMLFNKVSISHKVSVIFFCLWQKNTAIKNVDHPWILKKNYQNLEKC